MDDEAWRVRLERYLAGECTLAERAEIEAWLRADPARQAYLDSLRSLGETWAQARPAFDSRAAWRKVKAGIETGAPGPIVDAPPHGAGRRRALRWLAGTAAAAAIGAIAVGVPAGWLSLPSRPAPAPAPREYATVAGQQMSLQLPDGTRLWLAPGSRLVLDGDYGRATRTTRLEGLAYFDVTHDDARPFRVLAGNTVAWDLGTRFAIRAFPDEPVRVAVEEGSVAIPQALGAPLGPGDLATVDAAGRGTVEHGADLARFTAWTKGTLEFRDTPLAEAVADLSRWYGVELRVEDPTLARRHITVTVTESSVSAALDLVAAALGARFDRRGQAYVLRAASSPRR